MPRSNILQKTISLFLLLSLSISFFIGSAIISPSAALAEDLASPYLGIFNWPVPRIAKKAGPAIVGIASLGQNIFTNELIETSSGSGVIIDAAQGYIVTNNHVVEGARSLQISLADGRTTEGRVVGRDPRSDLAVVKISIDNLTAVPLGTSSNLDVGELVIAIGNPLSRQFARTVTHGIISALDRTLDMDDVKLKVLQIDAPINPGNSGGGLFNINGELIGINSAKIALTGVEGMGFSIPIDVAKPIIEQLINKGYVARPWLGIEGIAITNVLSEYYDLPQGIYIRRVSPNSPASKAGLKRQDIILRLQGVDMLSTRDLSDQLSIYGIGESVSLTIWRQGNEIQLNAILDELPRN